MSWVRHIFIVRKTNPVIELEATPAEQTGEVVVWFSVAVNFESLVLGSG